MQVGRAQADILELPDGKVASNDWDKKDGLIKLPPRNNLLFGMCLDPGILCNHIFNTLWPSRPHHLKGKRDFFLGKVPNK